MENENVLIGKIGFSFYYFLVKTTTRERQTIHSFNKRCGNDRGFWPSASPKTAIGEINFLAAAASEPSQSHRNSTLDWYGCTRSGSMKFYHYSKKIGWGKNSRSIWAMIPVLTFDIFHAAEVENLSHIFMEWHCDCGRNVKLNFI